HQETCRAARIRGELSDQALTLRMSCLDRRLAELNSLTGLLSKADAQDVESSVQAAQSLSAIAACSNAEASGIEPPRDEATAHRVDALRGRLSEAQALVDLGKPKLAVAVAEDAVEKARSLGYRPIEAESLFWLGAARRRSGAYRPAQESFMLSVRAAEGSRH